MDLVLPDGGDVRVELRSAPFLAPAPVRAALAAGDGPGEPTQHGQVPGQGGRVRNPLDHPLGGGHRGQPTHADVDSDRRGRIGVAALWPQDLDPEDHDGALADSLQGGGEDARPAESNQPFQPPSVLARADGADPGQGDVAAIGLDPKWPGAEGASVRVSALALEPREADSAAVELAGPGLLPAPVGITASLMPLAKASFEI